MKAKKLFLHLLYYTFVPAVYVLALKLLSGLLRQSGNADNLGAAIVYTYGILLVATPVLTIVLMRFSLLKWYVDPIAAAEIPLFYYLVMIFKKARQTPNLSAAFHAVNASVWDDGGEGLIFLLGLFLFGLLASFSLERKEENSISYRIIKKLSHK